MGGNYFIFFDEGKDVWTETRFFFGAGLFSRLENDNTNYCLESHHNWYRYNGTDMIFAEEMSAECKTIENVCCRNIKLSSVNENVTDFKNQSLYQPNAMAALGEYTAIGMNNGRWVYQKKWEDRYLEYGDRYWLASNGVGKTSGHIHHDGGSICPEQIKEEWQVSTKDKEGDWTWATDQQLVVTCSEEAEESQTKEVHTQTRHTSNVIRDLYREVNGAQGYYKSAVAFGIIAMILSILLVIFFARRFRKVWGRGAQGTKLITETFELPF